MRSEGARDSCVSNRLLIMQMLRRRPLLPFIRSVFGLRRDQSLQVRTSRGRVGGEWGRREERNDVRGTNRMLIYYLWIDMSINIKFVSFICR